MNRNRLIFVAAVVGVCLFIILSVILLRFVERRSANVAPAPGPATTARRAPVSPNATLGNPSDATADSKNKNNYLLVKPQFVLSYNNDKGEPNWVSWHLQAA